MEPAHRSSQTIETPSDWFRLVAGLFAVFTLFHVSATVLGSSRGQHGVLICVVVLAATAAADSLLQPRRSGTLASRLGLGRPRAAGIMAAGGVTVLLLAAACVFAWARDLAPASYPGWLWLLPGLFAQGGLAEEVLFRGHLFNRMRAGRSFLRAAGLSMLPFVAVHLLLFFSMPWPVALASVLLAVVVSFPLAWLFELGGGTIWAPAILHFVIQATVKVIVFPSGAESFAIAWMTASAVVPLLVFLVRPGSRG